MSPTDYEMKFVEEENVNDHGDKKRHDDGINPVKKFMHESTSPYK